MTRIIGWCLAGVLMACGDRPAMQSLPKPDPGAAAGVAAAAAAAVALADPDRALKPPPEHEADDAPRNRGIGARQPLPGDVLDRLEHAPALDAGVADATQDGGGDDQVRDGGPARARTGPRPDLRLPQRPPAP